MRRFARYFLGSIDCVIILPLALLIVAVIAFIPPAFIIRLAHFLQKISSCMPVTREDKHRIYRRWTTALARLRRYLRVELTCLGEAIVLQTMLRFSGVVSEIKLGIAREGAPTAAHAWLEIPGVEIHSGARGDFIEFSSQPFYS
jgi:hypothetical protein